MREWMRRERWCLLEEISEREFMARELGDYRALKARYSKRKSSWRTRLWDLLWGNVDKSSPRSSLRNKTVSDPYEDFFGVGVEFVEASYKARQQLKTELQRLDEHEAEKFERLSIVLALLEQLLLKILY